MIFNNISLTVMKQEKKKGIYRQKEIKRGMEKGRGIQKNVNIYILENLAVQTGIVIRN